MVVIWKAGNDAPHDAFNARLTGRGHDTVSPSLPSPAVIHGMSSSANGISLQQGWQWGLPSHVGFQRRKAFQTSIRRRSAESEWMRGDAFAPENFSEATSRSRAATRASSDGVAMSFLLNHRYYASALARSAASISSRLRPA